MVNQKICENIRSILVGELNKGGGLHAVLITANLRLDISYTHVDVDKDLEEYEQGNTEYEKENRPNGRKFAEHVVEKIVLRYSIKDKQAYH